jgi:hypothetical protein
MFWNKCPVFIFRAEVRRLSEVLMHPKDLTVDQTSVKTSRLKQRRLDEGM